MRIPSLLLIIALVAILGCDPNKMTSSASGPHGTKIIVKLIGKYAADEIVDVTIGTGGATTLGKGAPADEAYANVDPGSYAVTGIAHGCETGSWSTTTTVEEGQQKTINFNVDDATLIVKPDILWAGKHSRFKVFVYTTDGQPSFIVGAGETGTFQFRPGKTGNQIHIRDADTDEALLTDVIKVFYNGKLTYSIPYK